MCTIGTRTGNQVRTAGSFNGISKIFYRFIPVVRCIRIQRFLQFIEAAAVGAGCLKQNIFCVIQLAELPFAILVLRNGAVAWSILAVLGEEDESPQLRIMNIDDAGRSPYPVVFRENISVFIGAFYVSRASPG